MFHVKPRIVAVANQKGGVGKTTTTISLGATLAAYEQPTLLVDLDPQSNCTSGLGYRATAEQPCSYGVLMGSASALDAVVQTEFPHLGLLPSTPDLAGAEVELVDHPQREFMLRAAIASLTERFDFIILDCPPSLGLLTVNSLVAADTVLVPIQTEYYALEGLGHLLHTISLIHEHLNPRLTIEGILLTMYDARTNLSGQVADEVAEHFGELVFETIIPRNVKLSEAPSFGQPIIAYDKSSRGSQSYQEFAREFLLRNQIDPAEVAASA